MSEVRVHKNVVVELVYVMRDETGAIVDRRDPDRPAVFIYGHKQVLPQIETAILNETSGFLKNLKVPSAQAFGDYRDDLRIHVRADDLPKEAQIGQRFKIETPNGDEKVMTFIGLDQGMALLDGNHPLAGKDLEIDLRILNVRLASAEEIETGKAALQPQRILH